MKKIISVLGVLVVSGFCAAQAGDIFKANSIFYDKTTSPYSDYFDGSFKPTKTGESSCTSYFRLVTVGDCSIKKAMDDAKITRINSIDRTDKSILLFHKVTLLVHGE